LKEPAEKDTGSELTGGHKEISMATCTADQGLGTGAAVAAVDEVLRLLCSCVGGSKCAHHLMRVLEARIKGAAADRCPSTEARKEGERVPGALGALYEAQDVQEGGAGKEGGGEGEALGGEGEGCRGAGSTKHSVAAAGHEMGGLRRQLPSSLARIVDVVQRMPAER